LFVDFLSSRWLTFWLTEGSRFLAAIRRSQLLALSSILLASNVRMASSKEDQGSCHKVVPIPHTYSGRASHLLGMRG
jgi:hypothetical protein